ncbi:MAG: chloride channel protein [Lachnospiraceae bacterium]|nr:chloride channel protein [Lachnospiraceae bacterium]
MGKDITETALVNNIKFFIRWALISGIMGVLCGLVGSAFGHGVHIASDFFGAHDFMLYLMPVSGILIVIVHKLLRQVGNKGTNVILESIHSSERIKITMLPTIFISTILSQFVGASAGKEGAALQIGSSIANLVGDILKLNEKDKKIIIMCGMSGCFGAIFGTPLAATMFGMEVAVIGVSYYTAFIPCVFAAFIGAEVSHLFGLHAETFTILNIPEFQLETLIFPVLIGILGAIVSICFCELLHEAHKIYHHKFHNLYVRIIVASVLFIALTLVFGRDYCGAGFNLVEQAMHGESRYEAFLLKMLFTAVALGGGFKGGEIVPTLAIGATLGSAFGNIIGFEPSLCAACGVLALFVGATNCTVATLFLGFELFGFDAMPYFAVTVAISFALSGYYGLYSSQKFAHATSKTELKHLNHHPHHPHHSHHEPEHVKLKKA